MGRYIDAVRRNVPAIVNGVVQSIGECDVRCAVITYRDKVRYSRTDDPPAQIELDLTLDTGEVQRVLEEVEPRGGDDWAEDVVSGLVLAADLSWHPTALKLVILVGDAPTHGYLPDLAREKGWPQKFFDNFPTGSPSGDEFPDTVHAELMQYRFMHLCAFGCEPGIHVVPGTEQMFRDFAREGRYFVLSDATVDTLRDHIVTFARESFDKDNSERGATSARQGRGDFSTQTMHEALDENAVRTLPGQVDETDERLLRLISPRNVRLDRDEETGERIEIGRGSFGVVYRGKLRKVGEAGPVEEEVAVKEISLRMIRNGREVSRDSANEIKTMLRLSNSAQTRRVVELRGHCRAPLPTLAMGQVYTERPYYIVMRLMDMNLKQAAQAPQRFSLMQWYKFLHDIAVGVESLHTQGYVHCDLKPENVLLSSKPRAYISDFRTAKVAGELTSAGGVGSPAFTAPEVNRRRGVATWASDIYSFGRIIEDCAENCDALKSALEMDDGLRGFVSGMTAQKDKDRPDSREVAHFFSVRYDRAQQSTRRQGR